MTTIKSTTRKKTTAPAAAANANTRGDYPFEHLTQGVEPREFCRNPQTRYPDGYKGEKNLKKIAGLKILDRTAELNNNGSQGGIALVDKTSGQIIGAVAEDLAADMRAGQPYEPRISLVKSKEARKGYEATPFFLMHKLGAAQGETILEMDFDLDDEPQGTTVDPLENLTKAQLVALILEQEWDITISKDSTAESLREEIHQKYDFTE